MPVTACRVATVVAIVVVVGGGCVAHGEGEDDDDGAVAGRADLVESAGSPVRSFCFEGCNVDLHGVVRGTRKERVVRLQNAGDLDLDVDFAGGSDGAFDFSAVDAVLGSGDTADLVIGVTGADVGRVAGSAVVAGLGFTASATVVDDACDITDTIAVVSVNDAAVAPDTAQAAAGDVIVFAAGAALCGGSVVTTAWELSGAPANAGTPLSSTTAPQPRFAPTVSGLYFIGLTTTDDRGATAEQLLRFEVRDAAARR